MAGLLALSRRIDGFLDRLGRIGSFALLGLVVIVIFDVVTRRFMNVGSTQLQEAEWHLHTVLIMLCLGLAYVRNAHVRIDLVRERLSPRNKAWIELLGCLFLLMPFCVFVGYHATHFAWTSYIRHEVSQSVDGLPYRFAIKAMLPLGIYLLALAGISRIIVSIAQIADPNLIVAREEQR